VFAGAGHSKGADPEDVAKLIKVSADMWHPLQTFRIPSMTFSLRRPLPYRAPCFAAKQWVLDWSNTIENYLPPLSMTLKRLCTMQVKQFPPVSFGCGTIAAKLSRNSRSNHPTLYRLQNRQVPFNARKLKRRLSVTIQYFIVNDFHAFPPCVNALSIF
jgi:hypothetical protein